MSIKRLLGKKKIVRKFVWKEEKRRRNIGKSR